MRVDIVTIFPEYFAPLDVSLLGKARQRGLLDLRVHDLREWADDAHRTVDDTPYGGGPGMVMKPEPWWRALTELTAEGPRPRIVVPTPAGRLFCQPLAAEFAAADRLIFCCGRYEGIDARVVEHWADDEVSIGDYVLAGGEAPTLVMLEAVSRLLPGVLGNLESVHDDSFATGLLEGPVFTRPAVAFGYEVPPVLLSGNHGAVAEWRRAESLRRTAERRPELLAAAGVDPRELARLGLVQPDVPNRPQPGEPGPFPPAANSVAQ